MLLNRLFESRTTLPAAVRIQQIIQGPALQWLVASLVGLALGFYVVVASLLPQQLMFLLLVAALGLFAVIIVGHVRQLLLAAVLLDIPFQLDTYLFYRDDLVGSGALGGLNISVATLALGGLYILWLAELLTRKERLTGRLFYLSLPLAMYLAAVTFSALIARSLDLAIFEIFLLGQTFFLYLYIVNSIRTRQDILFVMTVLLIGLLLESLIMVGLRAIGYSVEIATITARIDGGVRVGGTIGSPNNAAAYLSLLLGPALGILMTRLEGYYKWLAAVAFCFGAIAMIFTLSRGGWVAFILSIMILCALAWYKGWLSLIIPIIIVVVVALLLLLFQDTIATRLTADDNGSAYSRVPLMELAFNIIKDNPVLGVGANNFALVIPQYAKLSISGAWIYVVHNKYLLVWAETGIIGLLTFIGFLLTTLGRGLQGWKSSDRFVSVLSLSFVGSIVGHMFHMTAEPTHGRTDVQMLWLVAGLVTVLSCLGRDDQGCGKVPPGESRILGPSRDNTLRQEKL